MAAQTRDKNGAELHEGDEVVLVDGERTTIQRIVIAHPQSLEHPEMDTHNLVVEVHGQGRHVNANTVVKA